MYAGSTSVDAVLPWTNSLTRNSIASKIMMKNIKSFAYVYLNLTSESESDFDFM